MYWCLSTTTDYRSDKQKANQKTRAPLWLQREDLHQAVHDPWDGAWANQIANGMDDWGVAQIGIRLKVISSKLLANGVFSWLCVHMFFRQFPDLINKVSSWHPTMFHFRDTTKLTTGFLLTGRQDKKEDSSGLNKSRHRKTVHSQPNLKMHPCNPLQAVSLTSFTSATSCKLSRRRLSLGTSEDLLNWNTISSFNTNTWYSSHIFSHVNNPSHEASSKKHTAKLYITKHNLESCTEVWLIGSNILHLPCWPKGTMTHLPVMCGSLWGLVFLVVNNPQFLDKEHQDHPIQGAYRLYKSLHHQPQVPSAWRIGVTSESCTLEL